MERRGRQGCGGLGKAERPVVKPMRFLGRSKIYKENFCEVQKDNWFCTHRVPMYGCLESLRYWKSTVYMYLV